MLSLDIYGMQPTSKTDYRWLKLGCKKGFFTLVALSISLT
jgi:hypothetical protein